MSVRAPSHLTSGRGFTARSLTTTGRVDDHAALQVLRLACEALDRAEQAWQTSLAGGFDRLERVSGG
jgi:hypothetical protein